MGAAIIYHKHKSTRESASEVSRFFFNFYYLPREPKTAPASAVICHPLVDLFRDSTVYRKLIAL